MSATSDRRRRWPWFAAALALCTCIVTVYAAGLSGPFVMDDFDAIFPLLGHQAAGADWLDILRNAPHHVRARWVANASFLISQSGAAGPAPSAFAIKAGNLAIHLATALALGMLARALALRWGATRARAAAVALLAAGLFALHPLLVSTVLYAVQRMAQLATLFSLLAVLAYLHWRERLPTMRAPAAHATGLAAVAGFAGLAFFSKESGALVPLLIGVVEATAFRWPPRDAPWRSRFETGFGLCCAAPLMLGLVLLAIRWEGIAAGYGGRDFTLATRLLTEIHVVAGYLAQIAWPRIGAMGLYHDDIVPVVALQPATIALAAAFAAAIFAAAWLRRRWPAAAFAILWFFAAHVLESTVIPLELAFEHRNYLALVGPAIAVAWFVARAGRIAGAAIAIVLLVALATQTARRAQDWSGFERWIAAESRHHPRSLRAASDLFFSHVTAERTAEAVAARERLLGEFPASAQPVLLKLVFACRGPLAVTTFSADELQALARLHVDKDGYHAFSGARRRLMRSCPTPDWGAVAAASAAAAANPAIAGEHRARAAWLRLTADAHRRDRQWARTRTAVEQVLQQEANDPRDWLLLAEAAVRTGDRAAYLSARQRLLVLLPGGGPLAPDLAAIDRLAAALPAGNP